MKYFIEETILPYILYGTALVLAISMGILICIAWHSYPDFEIKDYFTKEFIDINWTLYCAECSTPETLIPMSKGQCPKCGKAEAAVYENFSHSEKTDTAEAQLMPIKDMELTVEQVDSIIFMQRTMIATPIICTILLIIRFALRKYDN